MTIHCVKKYFFPIRKCQYIIYDGFYIGNGRICGKKVTYPNKFLCDACIKDAESEGQAIGREE